MYLSLPVVTGLHRSSFGMLTPGRQYANGSGYRYSINGQEKERDIQEHITSAEFGFYDSRIAMRWNLDPKPSVDKSPYSMFGGNPVWRSDPLLDTARVPLGANGQPTGQLGQRFNYANDGSLTKAQFEQMQTSFTANLNQQINQGGHTFNGSPVSLNTDDQQASVINVTFGVRGTSSANMQNNTMFISLADMQQNANVSTHEWLHTAGLMDRYYEVWGYSSNRGAASGTITINSDRSATPPMRLLPTGYDPNYNSTQNVMSVSGNQITQQQWEIVFAGISERSLGGLGVVSALLPNTGQYSLSSPSYMRRVYAAFDRMAFSGSGAFMLRNVGGTVQQVPWAAGNREYTHWIIHGQGGNIYPSGGPVFDLSQNPNTSGTLNTFRR